MRPPPVPDAIPNFPYQSQEVQDLLARPGLLNRLRLGTDSGSLPYPVAHALLFDTAQFRRAEENHRQRPDLYPAPPGSPPNPKTVANRHNYPTPFTPRETHRPDRLPGTPAHAALGRIVDRIDTEMLTEGLQSRVGTDADRAPDPPTLRDQIAAAVEVHAPTDQ